MLGLPEDLDVSIGGLDRTSDIADACVAVWPSIIVILCWLHIACKLKKGKFAQGLTPKRRSSKRSRVDGVRALLTCRTTEQLDLVA